MAVTLPKDDVRYKVGIDVGLNSIGFCAVEVDDDDCPIRLLNSLVFRHDAGIDPASRKTARCGIEVCVGAPPPERGGEA